MLIKTIEDKESGRKWEIFKQTDNRYYIKYYEYYSNCGWKLIQDGNRVNDYYSKDCIEYQFDIAI